MIVSPHFGLIPSAEKVSGKVAVRLTSLQLPRIDQISPSPVKLRAQSVLNLYFSYG